MDSDADFHEESEYLIGFKIWVTNDELSSTFRKKCFLFFAKSVKKCKKSKKYFTGISIKIGSISETFITKMISVKSSTNPESFVKCGRGRRIGWRLHMDTPI
jgi:hypothetical protein